LRYERIDYLTVSPPAVEYRLDFGDGETLSIWASIHGVKVEGDSGWMTDQITLNKILSFAHYQQQRIKERGSLIPQDNLERGTV
jgi:hypothetical protein